MWGGRSVACQSAVQPSRRCNQAEDHVGRHRRLALANPFLFSSAGCIAGGAARGKQGPAVINRRQVCHQRQHTLRQMVIDSTNSGPWLDKILSDS